MKRMIVWGICLCVLGGVPVYAKDEVRVCEHPDGTLTITKWTQEFLNKPPSERPTSPDLIGLPCTDQDIESLPKDRARRDAWRKKANGKIEADPSIKTPKEAKEDRHESLRQKLGLSSEEMTDLRGDL